MLLLKFLDVRFSVTNALRSDGFADKLSKKKLEFSTLYRIIQYGLQKDV